MENIREKKRKKRNPTTTAEKKKRENEKSVYIAIDVYVACAAALHSGIQLNFCIFAGSRIQDSLYSQIIYLPLNIDFYNFNK